MHDVHSECYDESPECQDADLQCTMADLDDLGLDIFLFNTCDIVTGHPSSLSMEDSQSAAAFGLRRFVKVVRDVCVYKTLFFCCV